MTSPDRQCWGFGTLLAVSCEVLPVSWEVLSAGLVQTPLQGEALQKEPVNF